MASGIVYSTDFFDGTVGTGTTDLGEVPSGFVWVVIDIVAISFSLPPVSGLYGFTITRAVGATILAQQNATAQRLYHWHGKQVLNPGTQLEFVTYDFSWDVSVSGDLLSIPPV